MLSSIYLSGSRPQSYKELTTSTVATAHPREHIQAFALLSANDGKLDSFDLDLFFIPLQRKQNTPQVAQSITDQ
jgi:hypothetical protein